MVRAVMMVLWTMAAIIPSASAQEAAPPSPPAPPRAPKPPGPGAMLRMETPAGETWLGVQLTPVPAALAAHLQIDGDGLMVRNVFRDSPADKAGIERYDVIVAADDQKVTGGVEAFSKHVRSSKPGDKLTLAIFHKGSRAEVEVPLAAAPSRQTRPELKYPDDEPDVLRWNNFGLRGKILRPGPEGWSMEDLGELPDADRLMWLWRDHGGGGGGGSGGAGEGSGVQEARRVDKDGMAIHVRRQKDGRIEVKRFAVDEGEAKAKVETYGNLDELKQDDAQAYELYQQMSKDRQMGRDRQSDRDRQMGKDRQMDKDRQMGKDRPDGLGPDLSWERPGPQPGNRAWREWRERFFQGPMREPKGEIQPRPAPLHPEGPGAPPQVRFDVDDEGRVTVHVRKDDAEMNMTFKTKDAFKQRAPELYRQFEQMNQQLK